MTDTILVTGATGNIGKNAVEALVAKGYRVRAASRHPERTPASRNIQPVKLDFGDPHSIDGALAGVTAVLLVAPPLDPDAPAKVRPLIEKARALRVRHIVFISALGVEHNEQAPLRVIERMVMDSGVNWTILRPTFFMENFSAGFLAPMIRSQGGIFLAAGDGKTAFVSTKDIAAVVAAAFAEQLFGQTYQLTGPNALDHGEVARIIGAAAGRTITYHAIPEEAMLEGARKAGVTEGAVQYMGALYAAVRAGYTAGITDDIARVTGQEPIPFEAFAQANQAAWR